MSDETEKTLRHHVEDAVAKFLADSEGCHLTNLYEVILKEVEIPLIETALAFTAGNQSETARMLGINRGTLRKKIRQYSIE
ncbi:Fis family transcriptional regulator [Piscirickettsia salmonis]|uniref:Putative Fis-like DNA-binding protein n=1 Tax=Piscirickettsia salmonis TaxID=1238 RepID=A0A095BR04_PISSA|nr:helix-turn-helix domain-containing protein [Piscirickettsia salmonis]OAJ35219.1 DNA-binding protein Fis [Piscirickettsiaceae bacterium NZ-RLO1]RNC78926.1 Fis family transcriptional regulator [Piscirickettsiaceae bacterium NZ-RLO2]AKP74674.2 Fis family transcriptional regulator [Piscirickettsia salmonis LF-89 = ATCC VR-1361]ALA26311.1 Fis family transcriptional regulator [Piscirickettsia salmonis]ALB21409.1 transposase [Piscirickettsia salmonis]